LLLPLHWQVLQTVHDDSLPHLLHYNSSTWLSMNSVFYIVVIIYGRIKSLLPYLAINDVRVVAVCEYGFECSQNVVLWRMPMRTFFRYAPLRCGCLELQLYIKRSVKCRDSYCSMWSNCCRARAEQLISHPENDELSAPLPDIGWYLWSRGLYTLTPANTAT
jgi:hypothetical protein